MPKPNHEKDNSWRLSSPAADDVKWYFRHAASALGLRAAKMELTASTLISTQDPQDPILICRRCRWEGPRSQLILDGRSRPCMCPACKKSRRFARKRPRPEPIMAVKAARRGAAQSTTEKSESVLEAVPRERRIRRALEQLPNHIYRTLQLAYEARQHGPEIRSVLGIHADLAMRLPRCQQAYARYFAAEETIRVPPSIETWLALRCARIDAKADQQLNLIRRDAMQAIADALEAYQRVREVPLNLEVEPERRAPRRSVAEEFRR